MIRFIISIILTLSAVIGAVFLEGFSPKVLLGFTSFLVVVSIPVFSSFGVWSAKEVFTAWTDPFSKKKSDTFAVSLKILDFQEKLFYISGITGTVIGCILVLNTVQAQPIYNLCAGFAASLVSILNGLLFAAIMRILSARVDHVMTR